MVDFLRIPQRRVGFLVGKNGRNKAKLKKELGCAIEVSKEGDVTIECEDALNMFKAKNIIKAIGRGFNVDNALLLLDDSYSLDIMNLKEIRLYLTQLTTERQAFYERSIGAGVTGITYRRFG